MHPHQCCSSATKPFCHPLWKFPGKGPWLCMYKDDLCMCSQSGMFRTLDSLLTCSSSSGLLLLPLPSGMLAGRHPAAHCFHFGCEELTSRCPRPEGGTSTLPTPRHQRSRDLCRAELLGTEQGMDPPEGLALAPEILPGPQLRLVHLAFRF